MLSGGDVGALDDRVAVITGGGRGIGRGITERFLAAGARVIVAQRSALPDPLVRSGGDRLRACPLDLADEDAPAALIDDVAGREGRLDVLVNNAGVMFEKPLEETGLAEWHALLAVNLTAPFLLCRHAAPLMRRGGKP